MLAGDLGRNARRAVLAGWTVALAGLLVYALRVATPIGAAATPAPLPDVWLYSVLVAAGGLSVLARAVLVREDRLAWSLIGAAAAVWAAGDVYWSAHFAGGQEPPHPSIADVLYLAFYPLMYSGLVLHVRARVRRFHASQWLDGLAGFLVVVAVGIAVLMPPILQAGRGSDATAVALNLVYPLADLLLLGLAVALAGLTGWRPGLAVVLLAAGCLSFAAADGVFLMATAAGGYTVDGPVDVLWPAGLLCMGLAAWQPGRRARAGRLEGWGVMAVPGVVAAVATALLVRDHYQPAAEASVWLAGAALVVCMLRAGLTFRENISQAATDALTGLPNRRLFRDRADQALLRARRQGEQVAVMIIDLDRFKEVNDTLGHHAGDLLLEEVAGRLRGLLRAGDTVARLGGDEFGVLLPAVDGVASAEAVAIALGEALAAPIVVEGLSLDTEASIGITLYPDHGHDVAELLQRADVAMYAAKSGSLAFCLYGTEHDDHSPERLTLVGELRRALDGDELMLEYQPKASLVTGDVVGVEALVRWRHPERGLLAPGEFIPVAERTALIGPLTLHVIERAVEQARRWENEGEMLTMAVNISAKTLIDPGFAGAVSEILGRWGIDACRLELEITETALMENRARALETLRALDGLGVVLAIDDFGVGYSSLSYLTTLPVSVLKIDRSFVIRMNAVAADAMIVRSTIDLARNLGLQVVAEGIETQEIADALRDLGCTVGQGFHIGRPVPAAELSRGFDVAAGRLSGPRTERPGARGLPDPPAGRALTVARRPAPGGGSPRR